MYRCERWPGRRSTSATIKSRPSSPVVEQGMSDRCLVERGPIRRLHPLVGLAVLRQLASHVPPAIPAVHGATLSLLSGHGCSIARISPGAPSVATHIGARSPRRTRPPPIFGKSSTPAERAGGQTDCEGYAVLPLPGRDRHTPPVTRNRLPPRKFAQTKRRNSADTLIWLNPGLRSMLES